MKRLIIINLILLTLVYIIPNVVSKEVTCFFTDTISFTIENIKQENQISSRGLDEPREHEKILHISDKAIEVLKRAERI